MSTTIDLTRKPAGSANSGELTDQAQTISGAKTFLNPITPTGGIVGKTDGVAIASGYVGQIEQASRVYASRIGLTDVTPINITSITLTPGVWDVYASAGIDAGSTTVAGISVGVSRTSATQPAIGTYCIPTGGQYLMDTTFPSTVFSGGATLTYNTPPVRQNISASTTIYLVVTADWVAGTGNGFGSLTATRIA